MKNIISIICSILILCFFSINSNAQVSDKVLPAKRIVAYMEFVGNLNIKPNQDPAKILKNKQSNAKVLISLFNKTTVAKIHVKLGTTPGKGDIAQNIFVFDEKPRGQLSFERDGKTVVVGLGKFKDIGAYHAEVILEDADGRLSEPKYYSTNL